MSGVKNALVSKIIKWMSLWAVLLLAALGANSTQAFTSLTDDTARAFAALVKQIRQSPPVLREQHILLRQMGTRIEEFLPYLQHYPKEDRLRVLLSVAEHNGAIKPTESLRLYRSALNGQVSEDDLIRTIKTSQSLKKITPSLPKIEKSNCRLRHEMS